MRYTTVCGVAVAAVLHSACAPARRNDDAASMRGLDRSDAFVGQRGQGDVGALAPAMVDGRAVEWHELAPLMIEIAGGQALREVALDRLIERECARRGVDIDTAASPQAIAQERENFTLALLDEGVTDDADEAARMLTQARAARGLGDERFARLLRRSAVLRTMVRDDVVITDEALQAMHSMRFGPWRAVRLITTPSLDDAQRCRARVLSGELFSRVAMEMSRDRASAAAGGVVPPIALSDPTWPPQVRKAAFALPIGALSDPIGVEVGYAVLIVDAEIPPPNGAPTLDEARPQLEALLRRREEGRLADLLAQRLLEGARIEARDGTLLWSWGTTR